MVTDLLKSMCALDLTALLLVFYTSTAWTQTDCGVARTCADCIGIFGDCIWCSEPDFQGPRCVSGNLIHQNCTAQYLENPQGRVLNLTVGESSRMEQFTPLAAELELRVGVPRSFRVEVTPTANYPLDIYILMDFSNSMISFIRNLRNVALGLASTLDSITDDFMIGFGAFNEKPIYPFTLDFRGFRTDYSFRHIVSLTENVTVFRDGIESMDVVANDDLPEALLEAMLQSIVCTEVIGWRAESRKLVLVFTDQLYHVAGDGRLAGIFRPHDGNCYVRPLNGAGSSDYTMSQTLDYPSIGQVRAKLQENDIIPVFCTVDDVKEAYMNVVRQIPGSLFQSLGFRVDRGNLDADLFLTIIENSFNATSQRIKLTPVSDTRNFIFDIEPTCPSGSVISGSACDGVLIGQTAVFNLSVTLTQCPIQQQTVGVRIPGFGMISLQLSGVCECSCETEQDFASPLCSMMGDHICGVCECYEERFGERCQCSSPEEVNLPCPRGSTRSSFCSARGQCECGMCLCQAPPPDIVPSDIENATYSGEGCECDNFSCPRGPNGLVCSGNGDCVECRQDCSCYASNSSQLPFRGEACQCLPKEEICFDPENLSGVCSGHGECRCEGCFCELGFEGLYCEAVSMSRQSCESNRACVECAEGVASSETDCDSLNCSVVRIDPVEMEEYFIDDVPAIRCDFLDGDNCLRAFYITSSFGVIHSEITDCGGLAIPVWSIVVIIVGGLILLGVIIIIIIKCVLVGLDRYELYRWEKERESLEHGVIRNPLYTNPKQKYENIAYGLESPKRHAPPTHWEMANTDESSFSEL